MIRYVYKLLSVAAVLVAVFVAGWLSSKHTSSNIENVEINDRVIGGYDAREGQIPYQVSLRHLGKHTCGGSIISEDWVLTAAHCFTKKNNPVNWEVKAGSLKHNEGIKRDVSYIAFNPEYNNTVKDGDIAVLKVETPFQFSETIECVPLAASGDDPRPGEKAIISGWGYKEEYGKLSNWLQFAEITIIPRDECYEIFKQRVNLEITDNMICAGGLSEGKDSCEGDSGGPLVIDGVQHGIVSFGNGCGRKAAPGVYTRVGALREFIKEHTGFTLSPYRVVKVYK